PKFHPALRLSSFYRVMKNALAIGVFIFRIVIVEPGSHAAVAQLLAVHSHDLTLGHLRVALHAFNERFRFLGCVIVAHQRFGLRSPHCPLLATAIRFVARSAAFATSLSESRESSCSRGSASGS